MFYREAGQYKTTYAADMAIFPIRQDRYGLALILVVAFVAVPALGSPVPHQHHDDPVPHPVAGGDRAQPFDRICRAAVARNRRLHGRRRLCLLQARDLYSRGQHPRLDRRQRPCLRARRRRLRRAEPAHQGLLFGGGDACGAVLSRMVLRPRAVARQLQRFWCDRGADRNAVRRAGHRSERDAGHALSRRADDRRRPGLDRLQHRARPDRSHVDGGPRHGHRRRAHRRPPPACEAARLRGVVVLCRRRGRDDGVPLARARPRPKPSTSIFRSRSCS